MKLVTLSIFLLAVHTAFACFAFFPDDGDEDSFKRELPKILTGKKTPAPLPVVTEPPEKPKIELPEAEDPISRLIGDGVNAQEFDPAGYNSEGGGPVDDSSKLSCNFDDKTCCWNNAQPPLDQLEWELGVGIPEQEKIHTNFGPFGPLDTAPPLPSGKYLMVTTNGAAASDEAQFVSCAVACSDDVIKVSARHWQTENALLQVCTRVSFFERPEDAPLLNCVEMPRSNSPGPTTIELPPGNLFDIVFVASNLIGNNGDAILLDDIQIIYEPCEDPNSIGGGVGDGDGDGENIIDNGGGDGGGEEKPVEKPEEKENNVRPPRSGPGENCKKTKCSFEDGSSCKYKDAKSIGTLPGFSKKFEVVKGEFENKITGIQGPGAGDYYIASYLFPGDKAALETDVSLIEDRVIRFQHYEATSGVQMKGCCDAADNCPFITDNDVSVADRQWRRTSFVCPKGTKKIIFVCENSQNNQGACAIDSISMYILPQGKRPEKAKQEAC